MTADDYADHVLVNCAAMIRAHAEADLDGIALMISQLEPAERANHLFAMAGFAARLAQLISVNGGPLLDQLIEIVTVATQESP